MRITFHEKKSNTLTTCELEIQERTPKLKPK